jgi:site-specific recombinase XerD
MTKRLVAALKAQRHLRSPLVFCRMNGQPLTPGRLENPLRRLCHQAGLRDVTWHVLRHTYCSHLAMRGAAPVAIQALAGHESAQTTQRYMHLAPAVLRETVRLLEDRNGIGRDGAGSTDKEERQGTERNAAGQDGRTSEPAAQ